MRTAVFPDPVSQCTRDVQRWSKMNTLHDEPAPLISLLKAQPSCSCLVRLCTRWLAGGVACTMYLPRQQASTAAADTARSLLLFAWPEHLAAHLQGQPRSHAAATAGGPAACCRCRRFAVPVPCHTPMWR